MNKTVLFCIAGMFLFSACSSTPKTDTAAETAVTEAAPEPVTIDELVEQYYQKQTADLEKVATVERNDDGTIKILLKNDNLFDYASAELSKGAKTQLAQIAKVLNDYPENIIIIEGYTDSRGTEAANIVLSQRRAEAVYHELMGSKLKTYSLSYRGYGPANPVATNKTAEGRAQNRRVNISIRVNKRLLERKHNLVTAQATVNTVVNI